HRRDAWARADASWTATRGEPCKEPCPNILVHDARRVGRLGGVEPVRPTGAPSADVEDGGQEQRTNDDACEQDKWSETAALGRELLLRGEGTHRPSRGGLKT